ncbi:hypothetical protein RQ831_03880 [Roseomonas gilardii]|uniref:Uncharacterized protein n=1 Tax=Roseomonas gilardii TaxID=257708 RepID=A0ABU3MBM6_9PROT|nr:hypothetical protein [Roseomonas gilardii]MDT8330180.1 hypothetical protein [Roseomonas gilardii]
MSAAQELEGAVQGSDLPSARLAAPTAGETAGGKVERWDPLPYLEAAERALHVAKTAPQLIQLLADLDKLNDPDPTRANWPDDILEEQGKKVDLWDRCVDRWNAAEKEVLERLGKVVPASLSEARQVYEVMAERIEADATYWGQSHELIWAAMQAAVLHMSGSAKAADDASMIDRCASYPAAKRAMEADPDQSDDQPSWKNYNRALDAIYDFRPRSVAGLVAKAQAAVFEATKPDGSMSPENGAAADWAWDLVHDILEIFGTDDGVRRAGGNVL